MKITQINTLIFASILVAPALAHAAELEQQLARCSALGDVSVRLGCFDALARSTLDALPATTTPAAAPAVTVEDARPVPMSRTVQRWELDDGAKRGVFAFQPYLENYLLLANYSTSSNDAPFADFNPGGIKAKHVELTYQISFKMKMAEKVGHSPVDLWLAYTQQSYWQAYNRAASSPFRETNYQPEAMAVLPLSLNIGGLDFRYVNLGLVHQSNGQTGTLSRSWNRLYTELGVERGGFTLAARIWKRLDNARSDNDNLHITDYMGHGDVRAALRQNGYEYTLMARRNFSTGNGALQAGWAFPLHTNLKGYVQLFSGYGESLIDYNYAQKSIGAGFLLDY